MFKKVLLHEPTTCKGESEREVKDCGGYYACKGMMKRIRVKYRNAWCLLIYYGWLKGENGRSDRKRRPSVFVLKGF